MKCVLVATAIMLMSIPPSFSQPADEGCFNHDTAYVKGHMNIRKEPTTSSPIVGKASKNDYYDVIESLQGANWCWIDIDGQWMAVTSIVSHDIADILPTINGDKRFTNKIADAFELLARESSRWFKYVIDITRSVDAWDLSADFAVGQVTRDGSWRIKMDKYKIRTRDVADIASTLIHEACHLYQYKKNVSNLVLIANSIEREKECFRVQARVLSQIAPYHRMVRRLHCAARRGDTWGC